MEWLTLPARGLMAVLCTLVLAAILISPAVPSPPTVVGKVHALLTAGSLAIVGMIVALPLGIQTLFCRALEPVADPSNSSPGAVFVPLRR